MHCIRDFLCPLLLKMVQLHEGIRGSARHGGEVQAGGDVILHGLPRQLRHPHPDGRGHRGVVEGDAGHPGVLLVAVVADKLQHGGLIHGQLRQNQLIALHDIGVAAGLDDQLMEGHIRVLHAPDIPAHHAVLEGVCQHGQLPYYRLIRRVGAEGSGLPLNGGTHLVKIDHVQQVQIQHKAAVLPRMGHHKADLRQPGDGLGHRRAGDAQRGKAALWMLRNKIESVISEKPFFMSAYFASFDESAHINGVYSKEAAASLEKIDTMLGELITEAKRITNDHVIICVVSDHGSLDNTHNISPNVLLRDAGLIEADDQGRVTAWKAFSQRAGGTAEIRLADPDDAEAAKVLKNVMEQLKADPESGILEVLTGEEAKKRGGFPEAAYVLVSEKGYELRDDVIGEYCRTRLTQKAQHGYSEEFPEMRASFMLTGEGIEKGNIDNVRLIDVAPTLAGRMGFVLSDAEGNDLLK